MAQAATKVIQTESGTLELIPALMDQLRGIPRYWPMELIGYSDGPPDFGLVFQHGEKEVYGVKMQFLDMPEAEAYVFHGLCRNWIAAALPRYLQKNHNGVMVPCAYFKPKSPGMLEAGLAFFVGPAPEDAAMTAGSDNPFWDEKLGNGATRMIMDMVNSFGDPKPAPGHKSPAPTKVRHIIDMDLRPRLSIGAMVMPFVIQGRNLIVVKHPMTEDEPMWNELVRAGLCKLPYASMVPAGLTAEQLTNARHG